MRLKIRRILALCFAIFFAFSLCGCWSSSEINKMAFVMGIGIDKGEGDEMFEVTVQIVRISGLKSSGGEGQGMGAGGKAYINICRSGEGIQMPMRDIARFIDRELYTGHNQVIVIGSEVAKGNIAPILDFFIRSADGRFTVALLIAKGRAYDILDHSSEMENLPATYLQSLIGERANGGNAPDATMISFLRDMLSSTTAPTIPIVEVVEDEKGEAQVILIGMGVFRGAGMCGVLRPEEAQAVLAVKNWESEYPHLEVCFGVETVLLGSGAILKPLTPSAEAD